MLKAVLSISLILTLGLAFFVFYFLPQQFHQEVHKELISGLDKKAKVQLKQIDKDTHQTSISNAKFTYIVTSVTTPNPLRYYLLVDIHNKKSGYKIKAKAYSKISSNVRLYIEFEDYNYSEKKENLSVLNPQIILTTPFDKQLLSRKKRFEYLLTNTKALFVADKISGTFNEESHPSKSGSALINGLVMSLATDTSANPDRISLLGSIKFKDGNFRTLQYTNEVRNFEQEFNLDSFSKFGIGERYKEIIKTLAEDSNLPLTMKLLPLFPKFKNIIAYPFEISQKSKLEDSSGESSTDLKFVLRNMDLFKPQEAIEFNLNATIPKKFIEPHLLSALSKKLVEDYVGEFQLSDVPLLDSVEGLEEKSKQIEKTKEKMITAIKEYLSGEEDGKPRMSKLIDKALKQGIFVDKDEFYVLKAEFVKLKLKLNDKKIELAKLLEIVPKEELATFLLQNGFATIESKEIERLPILLRKLHEAKGVLTLDWFYNKNKETVPMANHEAYKHLGELCLKDNLENLAKACGDYLKQTPTHIPKLSGHNIKCNLQLKTSEDTFKVDFGLYFIGLTDSSQNPSHSEPVKGMVFQDKTCSEMLAILNKFNKPVEKQEKKQKQKTAKTSKPSKGKKKRN